MSQELKSERIRFASHAPGHWPDVPVEKWNDWKWQLKNRVLSRQARAVDARDSVRTRRRPAGREQAFALDYAALLQFDRRGEHRVSDSTAGCPANGGGYTAPWEMADPCGRIATCRAGLGPSLSGPSSFPGNRPLRFVLPLLHPQPSGKRRRRARAAHEFDEAFAYLEKHTEVRDVLFSGGDALLFSDDKLEELRRVRAISHIEFVRIGTRVPIFLPQRITASSARCCRNTIPSG